MHDTINDILVDNEKWWWSWPMIDLASVIVTIDNYATMVFFALEI
jgi:hypothetical protein